MRYILFFSISLIVFIVLFISDLLIGSVSISIQEVYDAIVSTNLNNNISTILFAVGKPNPLPCDRDE